MTDVIIIGAGPAGMTAALYAIRAGLKIIVFESIVCGGQIGGAPEVENYPAVKKIAGWELAQNIYEQITVLGADIRYEQVTGIELGAGIKTVVTNEGRYEAKTVIIANGAKRRSIGCPGEDKFKGRGVSYCATCDGSFFKEKTVAVVGGGNTALEDALYLSNICKKVYLIHRRDSFRGEKHLVDSVLSRKNIAIVFSATVEEISGTDKVNSIRIKKAAGNESTVLEVSAVFVAIGLEPDNSLYKAVISLDPSGYIIAGEDCNTNVKGIYAAGDTRTKPLRQIITAAADGAVAASQAAGYISRTI